MKQNKLRYLLDHNLPSTATRLWSTWPFYMEALGAIGHFDYAEFVAEYAPFTQADLENLARAAELHGMGSMIKVDFLNRGYVAQKAVAAGFQSILFSDCRNAIQVEESVKMMKPDTPELGGMYGFPNRRFIGTQSHMPQMDHAKRLSQVVLCFMIEKAEALRDIEAICAIPGVDMVQFGPSDYSMSLGVNFADYAPEAKAAERRMIEVALKNGVKPRCEIPSVEAAQYYIDLGVRHFCLGDQFAVLRQFWTGEGAKMRATADALKGAQSGG
jgi:2-keto-3-deoxy-L-rhamnonate aldolase RhmA